MCLQYLVYSIAPAIVLSPPSSHMIRDSGSRQIAQICERAGCQQQGTEQTGMKERGQVPPECAQIQISVKLCADQRKEICSLYLTERPHVVTLSIRNWLNWISFLHPFSHNSVVP